MPNDYGFVTTFFYKKSIFSSCFQTGAVTLNSKERESEILAKNYHFWPSLNLTSLELAKSEEPKQANHLAVETFSFVDIGSVICFPMSIGTKFELEVAKISVSADDNFLVFKKAKSKYEVKSNQNNFYWVILNKALFLHLFSKRSKLTQSRLNPYKVNFDSSCRYRYTFFTSVSF